MADVKTPRSAGLPRKAPGSTRAAPPSLLDTTFPLWSEAQAQTDKDATGAHTAFILLYATARPGPAAQTLPGQPAQGPCSALLHAPRCAIHPPAPSTTQQPPSPPAPNTPRCTTCRRIR